MKKILLYALVLLGTHLCWGQEFNYQAVARNSSGDIIMNQNIGVQMSIRQGGAVGAIVYQETHTPTTNQYGLFDVQIGGGTPVIGTFNTINWSTMNYWVETAVDVTGGTTYSSLGASELQTVPYAAYAVSSPDDADADPANELITSATLNTTSLEIVDAGGTTSVDLSTLQDGTGTDDQNITGSGLSGTNLTIGIEGGNNQIVDLSGQGLVTSGDSSNMQPYLAVKYYIALTGTFPSRSNDPKILNDPNVITSSRSAQGLNPFIGEIMLYAGILVPSGWAECNGQLLPIASNAALFSLLGTTYGGDGITTFALPDLRGRVPMHYGNGPGLTNRQWGENGGSETVD